MKAQLIPYYLLVQFLLWLLRFALFYILTDLKIYKDIKIQSIIKRTSLKCVLSIIISIYSNSLLKANLHFLAYFPHFFQEEYCL